MNRQHERESSKKYLLLIASALCIVLIATLLFFFLRPTTQPAQAPPLAENPAPATNPTPLPQEPQESYKGTTATISNRFSVKVPGGWAASISNSPTFTAIMFSRPNQLDTLNYQPNAAPTIDENGIPSWNGLTEHFFIRLPATSQRFNPSAHLEIASSPFEFEDGTTGIKYDVIKRGDEAKQWGGLQKDTQWQGRTYIYEKNGQQLEAHLALYPSSTIDVAFYENVARTIRILE